MKINTISDVVKNGICTACGICAGACPKKCINIKIEDGIATPKLDETLCINCGICKDVCANNFFNYEKRLSNDTDFWMGPYKKLIKARLKNKTLLKEVTSGGVVTSLIKELISNGEYDCAFLVNTYKYDNVVKSEKITKKDSLDNTTKSRYITVSHEKAVAYILENKNKKVILVGTSCFVHGLLNIIEKFNLKRDNYFIIGLFCDKTMNNNVYSYFEQHPASENQLDYLHFRNKEVGNWPGGVRIFLKNGLYKDMPRTERMKVKDYFQIEGCLYCLDKLNIFADISVGDNYIKKNDDKNGINSVVIRTHKAMTIWNKYCGLFIFDNDDKKDFLESQNIEIRKKNLLYASLKSIQYKLPSELEILSLDDNIKSEYNELLRKIQIGSKNMSYHKIQADIYFQNNKKKNSIKKRLEFIYQLIYMSIKSKSVEYIKAIFKNKL